MSLISLLIFVLVAGLIIYLIFWAMSYLGLPEPIRKVVVVIVVLIAVVWLLSNFLPGATGWHWMR